MDVAALGAIVGGIAALGARDVAEARRERDEDRVEMIDDLLLAADHHAEAALQPPDPARGPDVDIMDALGGAIPGAMDVVTIEAVAAVDDDVARRRDAAQGLDGLLGRRAGGQHHPVDPRRFQLGGDVLQRGCRRRPVLGQGVDRATIAVEADDLMAMLHQPAGDARAHSAEADHRNAHRAQLRAGDKAADIAVSSAAMPPPPFLR
jgi:hypothetical protein